jgi:hypothetical protein
LKELWDLGVPTYDVFGILLEKYGFKAVYDTQSSVEVKVIFYYT